MSDGIWISKCQNNVSKRHKRSNSKDGFHWRIILKREGIIHAKRISASQARLWQIKLKFVKKTSKNNDIRLYECDKCGFIQEDTGQNRCENCHI